MVGEGICDRSVSIEWNGRTHLRGHISGPVMIPVMAGRKEVILRKIKNDIEYNICGY